jgi:hypothetical protein
MKSALPQLSRGLLTVEIGGRDFTYMSYEVQLLAKHFLRFGWPGITEQYRFE